MVTYLTVTQKIAGSTPVCPAERMFSVNFDLGQKENYNHAGMGELVDPPDLESGAFGRVGSNPTTGTFWGDSLIG